jgi:Tfp pilus assembly ATPase PilU
VTGNLDFAWLLEDGPHKGERFRINFFTAGRALARGVPPGEREDPGLRASCTCRRSTGRSWRQREPGARADRGGDRVGQVEHARGDGRPREPSRALNIITIEDPVEYRFTPNKSIISQREIGIDVPDFPTALRYVVRQDPDVIFIGEMRDNETILAAIQAAETGHLVFATLHTRTRCRRSGGSWSSSPEAERGSCVRRCRRALHAICAQKLIPAVDDFEAKIVPATEVLLANSPTVREKIREGEEADLPAVINQSGGEGMHSFTQSFGELVRREWVTLPTARHFAPNKEALDAMIKGVEVKAQSLVSRIKGPR